MDIKKIIKELIPYIIIIIVVVLIRTFLVTPIRVDGVSMYPTLNDGDIMILNKTAKVERFDIAVIKLPEERLIKRIIALPGETIEIDTGKIFINGEIIEDEYGSGLTGNYEEITLADDEYFVLGDNREDSKDSRIIGPIKEKYIQGRTTYVIFPFKDFGNANKNILEK